MRRSDPYPRSEEGSRDNIPCGVWGGAPTQPIAKQYSTIKTGMMPVTSPTKCCKSLCCVSEADALRQDFHNKKLPRISARQQLYQRVNQTNRVISQMNTMATMPMTSVHSVWVL